MASLQGTFSSEMICMTLFRVLLPGYQSSVVGCGVTGIIPVSRLLFLVALTAHAQPWTNQFFLSAPVFVLLFRTDPKAEHRQKEVFAE